MGAFVVEQGILSFALADASITLPFAAWVCENSEKFAKRKMQIFSELLGDDDVRPGAG
jgi:hypothetical protein